jgi:outer membrane immunogenic protein
MRIAFASTAVLALFMGASAPAQAGGSIKDSYVAPAFSWTGFYVGGHAGLGTGDTSGRPETISTNPPLPAFAAVIPGPIANFFATDYDMSGAVYGAHIGYNYQMGATVLGLEASYSGSSISGNSASAIFLNSDRELDWLATVTARIGYAMGRSLVYAKGGVAWGELSTGVSLGGIKIFDGGETHVGWTAGAGFEHAITNNVTFRIEYAHIDLGSETHTLGNTGNLLGAPPGIVNIGDKVDAKFDTITIGISYKF